MSWRKPTRRLFSTTPRPAPWAMSASPITFSFHTWSAGPSRSMVCLMVYLCGGIMEKHPNLKIICLETGASQMPWWLSRMDEHFEKLPHLVPWQKRKPSDIFNESVYVGCEPFEDGLFEWAVEYLGGDRLVLATDSPHWDSSVAGAGYRTDLAKHEDFSGEQAQGVRRERDQSLGFGSLIVSRIFRRKSGSRWFGKPFLPRAKTPVT